MKQCLLVPFVFFLSLVSSCKKDEIPTAYVPDYLRQMLPYKNGQVINFVSSGGGSITATVKAESMFVQKANCLGCESYVREEYINYDFLVGNRQFIRMSADIRPIIFMSILSPADNFQIGGGFDFHTMEGVPKPLCTGSRQYCLPSLTLNGKNYTDVLVATNGTTAANDITKAYYIPEKGLIGFEYGNGFAWSVKD